MKNFFKYVLATITGIVLVTFIMGLIAFAIIGALVNSSSENVVELKPKSIYHLHLNSVVVDRERESDFPTFNMQLVNMMYRKSPSTQVLAGKRLSLAIALPLVIMMLAVIILGFAPQLMDWVTIPAAQTLLTLFGK